MDDVLGSQQRRSPRVWIAVAVVALLAAVTVAVTRANGGGSPGAGSPGAAASAPAPSSGSPCASPSSPGDALSRLRPDQMTAPGPRVVDRPRWTAPHHPLLIVQDETVLRMSDVADAPARLFLARDLHMLFTVRGGTVLVRGWDMDGLGNTYVGFLPTGGDRLRDLGYASEVAASSDLTSVWLMRDDPSTGTSTTRVDVASGRVAEQVALPSDARVVADTAAGLVLRPDRQECPHALWDTRTGRYVQQFGGHVVESTARVAVVERLHCVDDCYELVDVVARTRRSVGLRADTKGLRLSPDERWLAAYEKGEDGVRRLVVHDTRDGSQRVLGGSDVSGDAFVPGVAWSRDSRTLYVSVRLPDRGYVLVWRAGAPDVSVLLEEWVEGLAVE